jgi:hypothetical protein
MEKILINCIQVLATKLHKQQTSNFVGSMHLCVCVCVCVYVCDKERERERKKKKEKNNEVTEKYF